MEGGLWGQPSAIYNLGPAYFQKGPADAYQRKPWFKNNWTKASEEKKKSKGPKARQTCLSWSDLLSRWEQKRKWAAKVSPYEKTATHNCHWRGQGFPILNLWQESWAEAPRALALCQALHQGHQVTSLKTALWGGCYLQSCSTSRETKARSERFTHSSRCFQEVGLGFQPMSPDPTPAHRHCTASSEDQREPHRATSALNRKNIFHTNSADGWKCPNSSFSYRPLEKKKKKPRA